MKFLHTYKPDNREDKVLRILEDDLGWLYIAKLPLDRDNIFPNIQMIEEYLGVKLELVSKAELKHDNL